PAFHAVHDVGEAGAALGEVGGVDLRDVAQAHHLGAGAGAGDQGLHLLGSQVLRLVDDEILVDEGAAAHEIERLDLDPRADQVARGGAAPFARVVVGLVEDVEIVLERSHPGRHFFFLGAGQEKMTPWMGALEDNLDILNKTDDDAGEWGRAATRDLIRSRIKIKSLNFMRGRTFINKYLVIDEAQNLTPKQMKTLITRAGPGTKVVCLGNIAQIDTPYLTEGSSGLTYVVDRMKGWSHSGHVTLQRGERSRLADHAA